MLVTKNTINFSNYHNIVLLTGAGISVASGLPSYRGESGLWNTLNPDECAALAVLESNPSAVWKLSSIERKTFQDAQPNTAHITLAEFESRLSPSQKFTLITQNIDGLHQQAGSRNVIEIHGNLYRTKCSNADCSLEPYIDYLSYEETVPKCPLCDSVLRPDIVLFGEYLPVKEEWLTKRALRDCDLFIAIGTSGTVSPASQFVRSADYSGARTILINLEPMNPKNPYFQEEYLGLAEELVPILFGNHDGK
ncbi:MAG: NAD-dependent deacetylase [Crocosphaera sp.]